MFGLTREPIPLQALSACQDRDGALCLFVGVVRLVHRLGRLEIGEASVVVAVSSPHRAEAFAACRHGIDALKARVPIWKKEFYADGSAWIDGQLVPEAEPERQ